MASPTHNPDSEPAKTLTLESPHDDSVEVPSAAAKTGKLVYFRRTKKKMSALKRKADKRFEVLVKTLNPIPFVPGKNLDFAGHEKLLKRLGIWDFVHVEFDREIRFDLVAQLMANFNQGNRCSRVNDFRVMVSRADIARALKLPVRKVVAEAEEDEDEDLAVTEESKGFILELLSNWVLLHDDTWIMPEEVVGWMGWIKAGEFEKLDWARMIWSMAEKELVAAPQLVDCYYASHFQCLIKYQRGVLFPSEEGNKAEGDAVKEEVDAGGDVAMSDAEEEQNTEASVVGQCGDVVERGLEPSACEKESVVEEVVEEVKEDVAGIVDEEVGGDVTEKVDDDVAEKVDEELGVDVAEKVDDDVSEKVDEEEAVVADADVFGKVEDDVVEKANEDVRKEEENEQIMDENSMDFEGTKEENDENAEWPYVNNNEGGDSIFLRQCSFGVELNKDSSFEVERKQEEDEDEENEDGVGLEEEDGEDVEEDDVEEVDEEQEEEEEDEEEEEEETGEEHEHEHEDEQGFQMLPKGLSLDCFPSGGLLHSIEAAQMNLSPMMPLRDPLGADFLSSRDNSQMPPLFGNGSTSKRELSLENDDSHNPLSSNKRLRVDGSWEHDKSPFSYYACLHQIEVFTRKAREIQEAKDKEDNMNQQEWMHELRRRDEMIEHLHKVRLDEQHRKDVDLYRLDRELTMMTNLLQSYRKALKETQREFAEYRASNPHPHDPVYKDVPSSGGLVVSAVELEKILLKQEEEARVMRMAIEREVKEFEVSWDEKFSEFGAVVDSLVNKLLSLEGEMKLVKESYAARKMSDPPESAQIDS